MSQNEKINEGLIAGGFKIHTTFFFFSLVRSLCVLAASEHRIGFTDRQVAVKLNRTGASVRRRTPLAQRAGRLLSEQAACSASRPPAQRPVVRRGSGRWLRGGRVACSAKSLEGLERPRLADAGRSLTHCRRSRGHAGVARSGGVAARPRFGPLAVP